MRSALIDLSIQPDLREEGPLTREIVQGWSNPVIPGDHPDPSIIRVGQHFWAAATSSEWSPQFPLFRSADLVRWEPAGAVFAQQPRWAEGAFWAPELVNDRGRFFCYYVARKRGGGLCVAVASATSPGGPYADHGPIVCDALGSIDPCFARDEHGAPYLIWKEDGNAANLPTPIWAQALASDMQHLVGERTMLITNDAAWEDGVVEGPSIIRHAHRFYMFYAGNTCCGQDCQYAEGAARADHLLGPWEKYPGNPLVGANDKWRCPGHGTAVHGSQGQDYLLYHAYPAGSMIYTGREAVLDRIQWGADGWPVVNAGLGPSTAPVRERQEPHAEIRFADDFRSERLNDSWQWPVNTHPAVTTGEGRLHLRVPNGRSSAMVAVPAPGAPVYRARVALQVPSAEQRSSAAWIGLSIVGDPFNTAGLGLRGNTLELWRRAGPRAEVLWQGELAPAAEWLWLEVRSSGPAQLHFALSTDGVLWSVAGPTVDAATLPAWDRGLRVGLMIEGPGSTAACFRKFTMETVE